MQAQGQCEHLCVRARHPLCPAPASCECHTARTQQVASPRRQHLPRAAKSSPGVKRLLDEIEVKQQPAQKTGRALLPAAVRKRLHGRAGGYGRASKRSSNRKLGASGAPPVSLIPHEYYPRGVGGPTRRFVFIRDRSKVHGVGLFAGVRIEEGEVLGFFTGTRLTTKEALAAHTKGAKSLVGVPFDEGWVWIDASRGHKCVFSWVNSSAGLPGVVPSVRFEASTQRLFVVANRVVKKGEELLADYQFDMNKKHLTNKLY